MQNRTKTILKLSQEIDTAVDALAAEHEASVVEVLQAIMTVWLHNLELRMKDDANMTVHELAVQLIETAHTVNPDEENEHEDHNQH